MLIEFPCPKCGGPALTQEGEVSCPLCGNQPAPPEAEQVVEKALAEPDAPVPPQSVEVPNVIEIELDSALSGKEDWTEETLAFAVEYLLGFVETYDGWPEVEIGEGTERFYFSPSSGQAAAIAELCCRYKVEPEAVVRMAAAVHAERERS